MGQNFPLVVRDPQPQGDHFPRYPNLNNVAPIGQDTKCGKGLRKSLDGSQRLPSGKRSL